MDSFSPAPQEIRELESMIVKEKIMLKASSVPDLDLDEIVAAVKKQYEDMAARSREEVEQWNQKKVGSHRDSASRPSTASCQLPAGKYVLSYTKVQ